ncbi:PE-PPE domain-containing protein [Mycolicibacterium sp. Dal123E01]|uniref:PE-PPE domain-containing protein n=1 Tax=Mycolicibacterium sp. Dal123E01 TaxID=3457578 RepID=UPI00403E3735
MTTTTAALKLLATGATILVMGGSGHSLSPDQDTNEYVQNYLNSAVGNYVDPASTLGTGIPSGPYNPVAVITPEEFAPNSGTLTFDQSVAIGRQKLDNCIKATSCDFNDQVGSVAPTAGDTFVVYGFSQSSAIATLEKRSLAAEYAPGEGPDVSFVMIANGNRPNGGFLARGPQGVTIPSGLPFAGATFNGSTPTNTQYDTVDVATQYDGWSDYPVNPLNLLAVMNAMQGIDYLHLGGTYDNTTLTDPGVIDQGDYGDTHYYMISTPVLPLLMPLEKYGQFGHALADTLDAPLRVMVESAYDRSTSPGVPTSWNVLYFPNPIKFAVNLAISIPTGLDNGIQDYFGVRPFRTTRPGPYGVGGPDVTYTAPDTTADSTSAAATKSTAKDTSAAATVESVESTVKKGLGGFKPHAPLAAKTPAATKTAAAAATETKTASKTDSKSGSESATAATAKTPKHSGVGGSKRAKASAGASS